VRYGRRAVTRGPVAHCLWRPLAALLACGCQHTLVVGTDPADGAAPGPASLADGLLAHWRLDDGAGAQRALDSSGRGDDAVPEAVSPTDWIADGRIGGALMFGNAGWLRGTDAGSLDAISDGGFSIALWIRVAGAEDREQVILQRQLGSGAEAHFLLSLRLGRPALSGSTLARCEAPALPAGPWVHLAATFDGTTSRLAFDGAEVVACPTSATFPPDTTSVTIGGGQIGPGPFDVDRRLRAFLDEVLLYSRALTPAEIAALAAGQLPPGK
jgi:hypothetical protein